MNRSSVFPPWGRGQRSATHHSSKVAKKSSEVLMFKDPYVNSRCVCVCWFFPVNLLFLAFAHSKQYKGLSAQL